nr:hypothetical protein [Cressdnaviricota sp.]
MRNTRSASRAREIAPYATLRGYRLIYRSFILYLCTPCFAPRSLPTLRFGGSPLSRTQGLGLV